AHRRVFRRMRAQVVAHETLETTQPKNLRQAREILGKDFAQPTQVSVGIDLDAASRIKPRPRFDHRDELRIECIATGLSRNRTPESFLDIMQRRHWYVAP